MFNLNRTDKSHKGEEISSLVKVENKVPLLPSFYDDNNSRESIVSLGTVLRGDIGNENNISIIGVLGGELTSQKRRKKRN